MKKVIFSPMLNWEVVEIICLISSDIDVMEMIRRH